MSDIKIGDRVQYVWGMPGPDYDEGDVDFVHPDGSIDIQFQHEAYGGAHVRERVRLSDRDGPVYVGYCVKVTRRVCATCTDNYRADGPRPQFCMGRWAACDYDKARN